MNFGTKIFLKLNQADLKYLIFLNAKCTYCFSFKAYMEKSKHLLLATYDSKEEELGTRRSFWLTVQINAVQKKY